MNKKIQSYRQKASSLSIKEAEKNIDEYLAATIGVMLGLYDRGFGYLTKDKEFDTVAVPIIETIGEGVASLLHDYGVEELDQHLHYLTDAICIETVVNSDEAPTELKDILERTMK